MEKRVVVEYKTKGDYCHCCNQQLLEPKISDYKYFNFTKDSFLDWSEDWSAIVEYDDSKDVVEEFIYETIRFFSVNSLVTIIVDDKEIDKAHKFLLDEVINS